MRDLFVTTVVFASLPLILWRPWLGMIMWTWLAFMNPHRLTWGFAFDMPFAYMVALTTLFGMLMSREPKLIPWTRETVVLLVFIAWMALTTVFAAYPELAWQQLLKVVKIQLMIFVLMMLMTERVRIHALVWTIALSIGFYGIKGGIFTVVHGGAYHVRGPLQTFIGGDNEIGLALIMTIPLMRYLHLHTQHWVLRWGMVPAMMLSALATVGTQSRGALVGLVAMAVFLWLKGRKKFLTLLLVGLAVVPILFVMPQAWWDRMATIKEYDQDQSVRGRFASWGMAVNLAKDRVFGGGFETFQRGMFQVYAPNYTGRHDAHSIYFEVLGEHGFVGLALFLALGILTWLSASWIIRNARRDPGMTWMSDLAAMVQVSLVGYASAGAFLGLAYFDYYYNLVAIVVVCKVLLLRHLAAQQPAAAARTATPHFAPRSAAAGGP
jgi:probable O-glycosylation ligase (exosortase A-associated)